MKRVNYFLTLKQLERLRALSRQTGLSMSELIRRAIDEYLEKKASVEKNTQANTETKV